MSYITLTTLKIYLGLNGTTDDTLLELMIDSACKAIDTYTKRTFAVASDTTKYFDVATQTDGDYLFFFSDDLAQAPTAVVTNADADDGGITLASTEYLTIPRNETPYYGLKISATSNNYWQYTNDPENGIKITGRWGYSVTPPDDIQQAALRLSAFYYRQKDQQLFDVTTIEQGVVIRPEGMPPDVVRLIKPYMRHVM